MKAQHCTHGEPWRKFAIKMLLNTRLFASFSEAVVAGAAVSLPWYPHSGATADWQHNSTGGYETLRASLAVSIIMPTALSFLDAD